MEDAVTEARRAYAAMLQSRSHVLAQRDALDKQLARIDSAIEALREFVDASPEPPATQDSTPAPEPAAPPQAHSAGTSSKATKGRPRARRSARPANPVNRKARIREIMLESPDEWLTAGDMASRIQGGDPSETQRTATYEMMRRMAKQGDLEIDSSSKPTKFRAQPAAIRERLLADED